MNKIIANEIYANIYFSFYNDYTRCGKSFLRHKKDTAKYILDKYLRYRENKNTMMTALQNIVTRVDMPNTWVPPPRF